MNFRHNTRGFSLLVLMIVVAIVGVLAAIVYPGYVDSIRKSKRGDAQVTLMEAARKMEIYYSRNASYNLDLTSLGYDNSGWNYIKDGSGKVTYRFKVIDPNGSCPLSRCYVLMAQAQNSQSDDEIKRYRLWSTGRKQKKLGNGWSDGWVL